MAKASTPSLRRWTASSAIAFMKRMMMTLGLVLLLFAPFHAYGNLYCSEGEVVYDHYAVFLRTLLVLVMSYGGVLWILRLALIACLLAHAGSAFHLWARNKRARGNDKYAVRKPGVEYFASRYVMCTMRWGGAILLLFIIWHILQYTTLSLTPGGHYVYGRAYSNMHYSFQLWWVWLIYAVVLAALCLHVWYGVRSVLQMLGAVRGNTIPFIQLITFMPISALFAAFVAVPTAILFGYADVPMATGDYYPQLCGAIGSSAGHFVECVAMTH